MQPRTLIIVVGLACPLRTLAQVAATPYAEATNPSMAVSGIDERGNVVTAPMALRSDRRLGSTDGTVVNGMCVDYTAEGYFPSRGASLSGVPSGYTARPSTISPCELESLHTECVNRLNMYRSGQLKFSDGTSDTNVVSGLSPLEELTGNNQCSSHQTLGDHVRAGQSGFGCSGAHFTAFTCASGAQNSCCSWHKETTYSGVKQRLFECLQSMWDEGITDGQKGHWETMRSTSYSYASCGFAWSEDGQLSMNQDFFFGEVAGTCSCDGKQTGEPDGCGGTCVACTEPVVEPCQDSDRANVLSSSCSGPPSTGGTPYCTCQDVQRFSWCGFGSVAQSCPLTCDQCPVIQPTCPIRASTTANVPGTSTVSRSTSAPTTSLSPSTASATTMATTSATTMATTTVGTTLARVTTSTAAGVRSGIQSGDVVFLKSFSGTGNIVDVEGDLVRTRWNERGAWQSLTVEKIGGGPVQSGDTVYLRTHTGAHVDVADGLVRARWDHTGAWQALVVEKPTGGAIMPDDIVCFRTQTGNHVDVQDGTLRARWDDCGAWQSFQVQKEDGTAVQSGDAVHLLAHTGNRIDVAGESVRARWDDQGEWQKLMIESGGRTIFSGDAVYLKAHTGNHIDVDNGAVKARWHDSGALQKLIIEKNGEGAVFPGDTVFFRAHTDKHLAVEGVEVTAHWHDRGAWQSLVIEKAVVRRLQTIAVAEESVDDARSGLGAGLIVGLVTCVIVFAFGLAIIVPLRKVTAPLFKNSGTIYDKIVPTADIDEPLATSN